MSATAAETQNPLMQLVKSMPPMEGTSKQKKADDEVEDKRKMPPTVETVTSNDTSPALDDDETPELTEQDPIPEEETKLTPAHRDMMLTTMAPGLNTPHNKLKANRFELRQVIAEKAIQPKSRDWNGQLTNRLMIVANSMKV